ncbi:MAG: sugar phosphate isomerase/epimerase [Proteobacteria bacterium]|nr:sugar phosphate isomerase/epimerase [Pseudomonadota bacterium]
MKEIISGVQVNIPFRMLTEGYLSRFLDLGLNPEIGVDADALDHFSFDEFKQVAVQFHERNLSVTVHGPFMDLTPASPDPDIVAVTEKRFDQLFRILPALSPRNLVTHAGYDPRRHFFMADVWLARSLVFFKKAAKRLQDLDCRLMLENVFEEKPEDMMPLFRGIDSSNAGICLDVGHMNALGTVGMDHWLSVLGDHIGEIHLHDNHGDRDSHLPMGQGTIDFKRLFRFIQERKPILTLEPHHEEDLYGSLEFLSSNFSRYFHCKME